MDKPTKITKRSSTAADKGNSPARVKNAGQKKSRQIKARDKKSVGETLNLASGTPDDTQTPQNYVTGKTEAARVSIYGLVDPISGELRYVGKTNNVHARYREHLKDTGKNHKANWIRSLIARGRLPDLFILEECSADQWQEAERFWIAYFRSIGADLTNIMAGGNEPYCPKEVRARNGKANASVAGGRNPNLWALRRLIGSAKHEYRNNPRIVDLANRASLALDTADRATRERLSKWFGLTRSVGRIEAKRLIMEGCHG